MEAQRHTVRTLLEIPPPSVKIGRVRVISSGSIRIDLRSRLGSGGDKLLSMGSTFSATLIDEQGTPHGGSLDQQTLDQVVADLNSDQSSQSEFDLALTSAPPPHHTLRAQPEFGSVAFRSLHLLGIFVAVDKDGHYKGLERVDVQIEDS